jgi:hypothetical protein
MDWLRENSIGDLQRGQRNGWLMTIGAVFRGFSLSCRGEGEVHWRPLILLKLESLSGRLNATWTATGRRSLMLLKIAGSCQVFKISRYSVA